MNQTVLPSSRIKETKSVIFFLYLPCFSILLCFQFFNNIQAIRLCHRVWISNKSIQLDIARLTDVYHTVSSTRLHSKSACVHAVRQYFCRRVFFQNCQWHIIRSYLFMKEAVLMVMQRNADETNQFWLEAQELWVYLNML